MRFFLQEEPYILFPKLRTGNLPMCVMYAKLVEDKESFKIRIYKDKL